MSAEPRNISIVETGTGAQSEHEQRLQELQDEIEQLAGSVRTAVERRARQAVEAAEATADYMRDSIRRQPWLMLAIAGAAGAALALAIVRPKPRSLMASRLQPISQYIPDDLGASLRNAGARSAESLAMRLERLADAIVSFDPEQASSHPLVAAMSRWVKSIRS